MLFCYSRGIKDLHTGYAEFQPEGRKQYDNHSWILPCCLWRAPASPELLLQYGSAGTGQSRTWAVLFGGTRACTGHAKPPGSCHCHLDRLLHSWHPARLGLWFNLLKWRWTHARTIFHFSWQSRASFMFPVLPVPLLGPSCPLLLLHSHPSANPY